MSELYHHYINMESRKRLAMLALTYNRNCTAYDAFVFARGLENEFERFFEAWMKDNGDRFAVSSTTPSGNGGEHG